MVKVIELNKNKHDISVVTGEKKEEEEVDLDFLQQTSNYPIMPMGMEIRTDPTCNLTPEQVKERRKLILHIQRYIKSFPKICKEWENVELNKKTIEELQNLLEEIKLTVGNSNSQQLGIFAYQSGMNMVESMGGMFNMELHGLTQTACQDPAIINCLKELSLEYMNLNYISPEKRLAVLTCGLALGIDRRNKQKKIIGGFLDQETEKDIEDEFKDL